MELFDKPVVLHGTQSYQHMNTFHGILHKAMHGSPLIHGVKYDIVLY